MPITSLTDYLSLQDPTFDRAAPAGFEINFNLPSDCILANDSRRPILIYTVIPDNSVNYRVEVNGPADPPAGHPSIQDHKLLGEHVFRTVHEAINGSVLRAGENTIFFRVLQGRAKFSDVVLMFQRTVTTL